MLLNPLNQNFVVWFPANFFYNDVVKLWKPVCKRLYLPYLTLEDMFNAQITSVSFPSIQVSNVTQQMQNFQITKRGGKTLEQQMAKTVTLTIKLTESYMTYFIARQQMHLYLNLGKMFKEDLYLPPLNITILDEGGFENITYTYYQLTPSALSDFDLSYAARPGSFTTFTWSFNYNYFNIWYRDENGQRKKMNIDADDGMLQDPGRVIENDNSISRQQNLNKNKNPNSMLV